jgi:hypothetical protein
MARPVLLVTRRLPQAVEERAQRDYDVRLNREDTPRSGSDVVRLADTASATLPSRADGRGDNPRLAEHQMPSWLDVFHTISSPRLDRSYDAGWHASA